MKDIRSIKALKEVGSHLLITFFWLAVAGISRFSLGLNFLLLCLGSILGTFLLDIDHLIYWFFLYPGKTDSLEAQKLLKQKSFQGLLLLAAEYHGDHLRLIFHSALFQLVLLGLTLYVFTAGESDFVLGLVVALNLHLFKDEWEEYYSGSPEHLNRWLFWHFGIKVPLRLQMLYLAVTSLAFLFLLRFVFRI